MNPLIYAVAAVFVAILLYFVTKGHEKQEEKKKPRGHAVKVTNDGPAGRRGRRTTGLRARQRDQERNAVEEVETLVENEEGEVEEAEEKKPKEKIGAKKLRKLQDKEHKKQVREAEERERAERKKLEAEKYEETKKKEEDELLQEQKEEAELERIRLEKEKREHEEYLKLKEAFSIEEEGQVEEDVEEEDVKNLLQDFIDYIKSTKVIFLEDLASHFGLRTQEAIDRVQTLLQDGTLTGVIDDRGKLIYISMEELEGVADFIKDQGRVSITELAKASNSLINLEKDEEVLVLAN